jgi:hypothetical protein
MDERVADYRAGRLEAARKCLEKSSRLWREIDA